MLVTNMISGSIIQKSKNLKYFDTYSQEMSSHANLPGSCQSGFFIFERWKWNENDFTRFKKLTDKILPKS